ncbi:MAG: hypothetical protein ACHP6H_04535, partial [Legionellales bacterium]
AKWSIDPEKVARNSFQVFATGDAFSVMSPDIEISGANVTIHVGLEHTHFSPLALIQEALQLCRCAYEHGSRSITIALPDTFHPIAHFSDFNSLILKLFKASGVNKVYFYDTNYTGKLDETNLKASIPLTVSDHCDLEPYHMGRQELSDYLQVQKNSEGINDPSSLDKHIMRLSRKRNFERNWAKCNPQESSITESLNDKQTQTELKVPEIKVQQHVLLCCSANKPLAKKIAASLRMRGEMVMFYSIEGRGAAVKIPDDVPICGAVVTLIQSTRPNPDCLEEALDYQKNGASSYLFEAAIIARQAHLRGAETVNLINPYQFSARSDKAEDNSKGKTGAYVQHNGMLLAAAGVNQVITAECHDNHTMTGSYTGNKIKGSAVSALAIISTNLAHEWISDTRNPMKGQLRLVTPDAGAAKRTKELTEILQAILGKKLCQTRVLGEKQRNAHKDDSALISSMNSGNVGINPDDKYLITDDETATGNTLCQAVEGLSKNGAKNISVVVVHNNMPLDYLVRQLCIARFFYLGVNDLHFSDTNEMGTLAESYEDLINHYAQSTKLSTSQVETLAYNWFKENLGKNLLDKSEAHVAEEFTRFKSMCSQFKSGVRVHSLANEFANKVITKPYMGNPHAFEYKVDEFIRAIKKSQAKSIVVYSGASLTAASAAALELGLPMQVIEQAIPGTQLQKLTLPEHPFALIGIPSELTRHQLEEDTGYKVRTSEVQEVEGELVIVSELPVNRGSKDADIKPTERLTALLLMVEGVYNTILADPKLMDRPLKLLGIGTQGHIIAGQLCHLLNKKGKSISIAVVDDNTHLHTNSVVYTSGVLSVDRNSLDMGDVCIAVTGVLKDETIEAISHLTSTAKVHCPYYVSVSNEGEGSVEALQRGGVQGIYTAKTMVPLFSQYVSQQGESSVQHAQKALV